MKKFQKAKTKMHIYEKFSTFTKLIDKFFSHCYNLIEKPKLTRGDAMKKLLIGWAEETLVPEKKLSLYGQF